MLGNGRLISQTILSACFREMSLLVQNGLKQILGSLSDGKNEVYSKKNYNFKVQELISAHASNSFSFDVYMASVLQY